MKAPLYPLLRTDEAELQRVVCALEELGPDLDVPAAVAKAGADGRSSTGAGLSRLTSTMTALTRSTRPVQTSTE